MNPSLQHANGDTTQRSSGRGRVLRHGISRIKTIVRHLLRRMRGLRDLSGDRFLEWTYSAAKIGQYSKGNEKMLDVGCGGGTLSVAGAQCGLEVLAIDLLPQSFAEHYPNIEFRQTNLLELDEPKESFSLIVCCSTIEHIGLGSRYSSFSLADGDLQAMHAIRRLLRPRGRLVMTIPVGRDAVFHPYHRVYGEKRLPRLLEGFEVVESIFYRKDQRNVWFPCTREDALHDIADAHYYALAFFVLQKQSK